MDIARTRGGATTAGAPPDDALAAGRPRRRAPRRLLVALLALVVLLAVFYGGGGWYFSGQIHAEGLAVDHGPAEMTLHIVDVGDRRAACGWAPAVPAIERTATDECWSVTMKEIDDEQPALGEPVLYGLEWPSGYGQMHGPAERGPSGEVTRTVLVVDGEPPQRGDEARLERSFFPDPESALEEPVEDVTYTSAAGRFPAWYAAGEGDSWAILVHGYRSSRTEVLRAMSVTTRMGMPTLAISYRNDAGVPQDPEGMYRFGETEWQDLEGAVQYALDQGAADVKIVANSMGGAVTASFLGRSRLADRVSAVVLDSPMLDFGETVSYGAEQMSLPLLGGVPTSLVSVAKRMATARYGVDWQEIDYLDDTSWVRTPTLVLHGTEDLRVPLSTSQRLAEAEPDLVRLWTVPGAEHVGVWNQVPQTYERKVRAFLR